MIDVKELRVRNWVKDRGKIRMFLENDFTQDLTDIEPIELTAEILEAAGFVSYQSAWWYDAFRLRLRFKSPKKDSFDFIFKPFIDCIGEGTVVKYVHQLQNIYYWLTSGEELEINLC
jgi:hypothetical protein